MQAGLEFTNGADAGLEPCHCVRRGHNYRDPFCFASTFRRRVDDGAGEADGPSSPPADSRLLAHYMTTPPEAPPVKLRRKAGYDAGSAFKRWALRRGKGE